MNAESIFPYETSLETLLGTVSFSTSEWPPERTLVMVQIGRVYGGLAASPGEPRGASPGSISWALAPWTSEWSCAAKHAGSRELSVVAQFLCGSLRKR